MKNQKTEIIRHGEVILKPETLPEGAILEKEVQEDIIAHSETGHHHVLTLEKTDMSKMKFYTFNGERYVEVPQVAELWHQKSGKDVHTAHKVAPAVYKIILKKEFDYFAKIIRQVRD